MAPGRRAAVASAALNRFLKFALVAAAAAAICSSARAEKLAVFRGLYRGTVAVTMNGGTFPGAARIDVRVHGRKMTVRVRGSFAINGKVFAISNRIAFSRGRTFAVRSITNGFANSQLGVSGRYVPAGHTLAFAAPFEADGTTGSADGAISTHRSGRRKQWLTLRTSVAIQGEPRNDLFRFRVWKYVMP